MPLDRILLVDRRAVHGADAVSRTNVSSGHGSARDRADPLLARSRSRRSRRSESSTRVAPTPVASTASSTSTSNRTRYLVDLYRFTVVSIVMRVGGRRARRARLARRRHFAARPIVRRGVRAHRANIARARVSAPSVAMTTSSSTTTRERLVVTMNDPTNASTRADAFERGARARSRSTIHHLGSKPSSRSPRRAGSSPSRGRGRRRPGGDDLDDDLRARVAHATGEPGIVRDRVSIGLHHDGIFTRVSPGASGGAVLGLSSGVWEF